MKAMCKLTNRLCLSIILIILTSAGTAKVHETKKEEPEKKEELDVKRRDFFIETSDHFKLFVREVSPPPAAVKKPSMLLLHGARSGSLASFDINTVAGYSLAQDLAGNGYRVFLMDIRGFGLSQYPKEMSQDRFENPPLIRSIQAVQDIHAVISELQRITGEKSFAALGWATGSQWLAHYASLYPNNIDRLVYYNGMVSRRVEWPLAKAFAKPQGKTGEFDHARLGAYRVQTANDLVGRWDGDKKNTDFIKAYQELSMQGDSAGSQKKTPTFRVPNGALADTLLMASGQDLWKPEKITAPVLIIRSGNDFWSRPGDPQHLRSRLTHSKQVSIVEIQGASHYVHLELGQHRDKLLKELLNYMQENFKNLTFVEDVIRPAMEAVPGVSGVQVEGFGSRREEELQIQFDPIEPLNLEYKFR